MPLSSNLNIWLNRSFATSYWLIKMLKENPDHVNVTVFATHVDESSPVLQAADYIEAESLTSGDDYVRWAIDFCVRNRIDVFIPRYNIDIIAASIELFEEIGVKVLASSHDSILTLEDKNFTYLKASETGTPVPPWRAASTADTIHEAYLSLIDEIGNADIPVVIKPTVGVGAQGFKIINNAPYTIDKLLSSNGFEASIQQVLSAYRRAEDEGEPTYELMLLPYLENPEISVDCLSDPDGKLVKAIPRIKEGSRTTAFSNRYPEAVEIVADWYENFDLRYLTNTQLRWWKDELVLLETNTRASGGLYSTTLTGVNLIWEAVVLALTGESNATKPLLEMSYIGLDSFTLADSKKLS